MAEQDSQNNITPNYNFANGGLNLDQTPNQIQKGSLTYALNATVESFDYNSINYQNEQGNDFCLSFPEGYVLIGKHFISEQSKHIFMLVNPDTQSSEIGYMENNNCKYITLTNASCLNFDINHPIHKIVHKISKEGTEIYWTDGKNSRRYLNLDDFPKKIKEGSDLCEPVYTDELDCNKIKIQPDFKIPQLEVKEIIGGGNLISGTYQFAIQYCDIIGSPYTSYYSITNPTPIADPTITTQNFNYPVGKSIVVEVDNLDTSGQAQYFNLAVIKTINAISSVELVGTYYIDNSNKKITYTGQQVDNIRLSINDIFEKFPYYELADDVTAVQDVLIWKGLTSVDRINYQSIANKIKLQWESWRIPATENYADEYNATNFRGYLRDEVYSFEIAFLLKNGKQTDSFHIPGRRISTYEELLPVINGSDNDFIDFANDEAPCWKIYNTASVIGTHSDYTGTEDYKGPYQYGEFAYWESSETYPCNKELWGELAGKPIRHHKFPDVAVSPIFESKEFTDSSVMQMGNCAVFPLGVKIDNSQIETLINTSNLTTEQRADIVGWKIVRGDRGTNKSIIAKGILRNVNSYKRAGQTYLYPNYPYNDLSEDPFLNSNNNAFSDVCEEFNVNVTQLDNEGKAIIRYNDCNTNKETTTTLTSLGDVKFCSIGKPTIDSPAKAKIGVTSYEVWRVSVGDQGCAVGWVDPINGYTREWLTGVWLGSGESKVIHVVIGSGEPGRVDGRGKLYKKKLETIYGSGNCSISAPQGTSGIEQFSHRQIFNSPETSFGQPFLGNVLKLENVIFGGGKAHFVEVKNNAKYKLLTQEIQIDALLSANGLGDITNPFNASAFFSAYQGYIEIYLRSISRKNFAYSYNSIAEYNYSKPIPNGVGVKQRLLDIKRYIIPGVQSIGDDYNINNYQRETSVFLKTDVTKDPLPLPNKTNSIINAVTGKSIIEDKSRHTISELGICSTPDVEKDITTLSYYASIKNIYSGQWGQIYSYDTIDTGYQKIIGINNSIDTIFGGDTFISRFTFKTKLPFFLDNRVGAPDDSDIYYDEIGNVAYPKYWHSARSVTKSYFLSKTKVLPNIISYKAHNFDCPNNQGTESSGSVEGTLNGNPNRMYYDGYYYLFAYGIPSFYCESSYNVDLRQAFNSKEGDFYPHVSKGIPDDWLQETNVTINQDNTYYYNTTYSKQNKENTFTHLPVDWESESYTNYPFRAIYSDSQNTSADTVTNNWLTYRALSYYDFPKNYGKLISLDGIQNRAILARFENKSLLYNNLLTIDTSNPQSAYVGNPNMFSAPPIDFAETDLGYVGSQHKFLLKIPEGQVTIDAKRGQVFVISGTSVTDISGFGSGMNRFLTDNLDFEILKYFPDIDIDNHFKDFGLHGVYDSKFDRIIITKLDYIPLSNEIKYNNDKKYFYIKENIENIIVEKVINVKNNSYFCNRSWTLSFSMNLRKWISFHSYIPNFYIAENNFFYSGINGESNDFEAIAGEVIPISTTTTTTTNFIPPFTTTTTTTRTLDCMLGGEVRITDCEFNGTAIITVPPDIPPCQRPEGLVYSYFVTGYTTTDPVTDVTSTGSSIDASNAAEYLNSLSEGTTGVSTKLLLVTIEGLNIGDSVYLYNGSEDCTTIPDGWYFTEETAYNQYVFRVVSGRITEIYNYANITTTTTTSSTTTTTTTIILDCTIEGTGVIIIPPTTTTTTTTIGDNLLFKLINPLNRPADGYINKNNYEQGPYLTINTSGMLNGVLNTGDTFAAVFKNNSTTQIRQVRYLYESSIRGILRDTTLFINVNVGVMDATFTKIDGETITITLEVLN